MFPPPASRPQPSLSKADLWVVAVLALFTFVVRGAWFGDPNADIDEQLYSLIGNAMLDGHVPFVDLWDRKPYGLFALFALAHAVGGPGPEAYQVMAAIFTLAGALMVFVLGRYQVDQMTAAAGGLLYIVLCTIYDVHSGNSEAFFIPMMVMMAILVVDPSHPNAVPRALAAMVVGGLALQIKYTVLPQCLFFGLWVLWGQYQRKMPLGRLVTFASACCMLGLLPTALVGAGYAAAGYWDEFVFANFISFFDRLPSPSGRFPRMFLVFMALLATLALLGINAARRDKSAGLPPTYVFVLLWTVASLASTFLPSTLYRHYLAAMIPTCVLLSLPLFRSEGTARINVPALLPAVLLMALVPMHYGLSHFNRIATERLASAIRPHVDGRDRCLLVFDGPTSLYRMTGSCLPTRYIFPDHLNNALESNALGVRQDEEVARILAARPRVIVTADRPVTIQNSDSKRLIKAAIARDYRELTHVTLHKRKVRAWILRE